jgi:hypothetical protein
VGVFATWLSDCRWMLFGKEIAAMGATCAERWHQIKTARQQARAVPACRYWRARPA